jgi:hypothetical protein
MINANTTRGRTVTSVDTPRRQLNERDLAIAPVLSAKTFGRVNASFVRRLSQRFARPTGIGVLRRGA